MKKQKFARVPNMVRRTFSNPTIFHQIRPLRVPCTHAYHVLRFPTSHSPTLHDILVTMNALRLSARHSNAKDTQLNMVDRAFEIYPFSIDYALFAYCLRDFRFSCAMHCDHGRVTRAWVMRKTSGSSSSIVIPR
jgi:hypothetical protein